MPFTCDDTNHSLECHSACHQNGLLKCLAPCCSYCGLSPEEAMNLQLISMVGDGTKGSSREEVITELIRDIRL